MIPVLVRGGQAVRPAHPGLPTRAVDRRVTAAQVLRAAAAVLLAGAGVVHAGFVPVHMEHLLQGAFFVGVAAFQLGGAVVLLRGASRSAVGLVIDGNAAIVLLWSMSRLAGPVLAPTASWTEPIGYADALCTAFEVAGIAFLALASSPARSPRASLRRTISRPVALTAVAVLGVAVTPLVGQALSTTGSHHDVTEVCASSACIFGGTTTPGHDH